MGLNTALTNITDENCQAVAISSMMVVVLSIGIPGAGDDSNQADPVGEVISMRHLPQGIFFVLRHSEASLRKGELSGYFDEMLNKSREGSLPPNLKSPPSGAPSPASEM